MPMPRMASASHTSYMDVVVITGLRSSKSTSIEMTTYPPRSSLERECWFKKILHHLWTHLYGTWKQRTAYLQASMWQTNTSRAKPNSDLQSKPSSILQHSYPILTGIYFLLLVSLWRIGSSNVLVSKQLETMSSYPQSVSLPQKQLIVSIKPNPTFNTS
jgi:hypothetical protein